VQKVFDQHSRLAGAFLRVDDPRDFAKNEGLPIHSKAWPRIRVSDQNPGADGESDEVLLNSIFWRSFRIYWLRNIQLAGAGECHCTFRPAVAKRSNSVIALN
jgi:hypothetical protein